MVALQTLVAHINGLLQIDKVDDYCPNGLQVEGADQVGKIVTGVTASQRLIDAAITQRADAILVHHGYFWKGEAQPIVGMKKRRIQSLLVHDISLLAYHLPLDLHPLLGNNAQLANQLGFDIDPYEGDGLPPLVRTATLAEPQSGEALAQHIDQCLARSPLHIATEREIKRVAWCTGAAQSYLNEAIALGVDAYITGEVSEPTVHEAREAGIHFFAAGHHATERYGVKALGEAMVQQWPSLQCEFIDCDNPV